TVGESVHGTFELPHDVGVGCRAEVEAVGDCDRCGAAGGDVAIRFGEREFAAFVRVEVGESAVAVHRDGHPAAGGFVDADHAGVGGWGEYGVAAYVTVELAGDPVPAGEVGGGDHPQQCAAQFVTGCRARELRRGVGLDGVLVGRACVGA